VSAGESRFFAKKRTAAIAGANPIGVDRIPRPSGFFLVRVTSAMQHSAATTICRLAAAYC
jgi:hypothetical protein